MVKCDLLKLSIISISKPIFTPEKQCKTNTLRKGKNSSKT